MPKTILVADDSVTIQKAIEITFAGEPDYSVQSAQDVDAAIASIGSNKPDIILADLSMSGKNGYDLCTELRGQGISTPVVFLHGSGAAYDAARGKSVGGNGDIAKPFETNALIEKVAEAIAAPATSASVAPKIEPLAPPITTPPAAEPPAETPVPAAPAPAVAAVPPPVAAVPPPPAVVAPTPAAETFEFDAEPPPATSPEPLPSFDTTGATIPKPAAAAAPQLATNRTVIGGPGASLPAPPPGMSLPKPAAAAPPAASASSGSDVDPAIYKAIEKLSREVIEQIVWEVVPDIAEAVVREHVEKLAANRS